jgi:hypothetical protein
LDPKVLPAVPKIFPLEAPLEEGVLPKENAMVVGWRDQGAASFVGRAGKKDEYGQRPK